MDKLLRCVGVLAVLVGVVIGARASSQGQPVLFHVLSGDWACTGVPSEDYTLSTPWLDLTCPAQGGSEQPGGPIGGRRGMREYFFPHITVGDTLGTYTPNGD